MLAQEGGGSMTHKNLKFLAAFVAGFLVATILWG